MSVLLVNRSMESICERWPDSNAPNESSEVCVQACVRTREIRGKRHKIREVNLCCTTKADDMGKPADAVVSLAPQSARMLAAWLIEAAEQLELDAGGRE